MVTLKGTPGGPVMNASPSSARGMDLIPDQRAKIPRASQPKSKHKAEAVL